MVRYQNIDVSILRKKKRILLMKATGKFNVYFASEKPEAFPPGSVLILGMQHARFIASSVLTTIGLLQLRVT